LALAREKGLDLIEVAPTAVPPVCKIMDYGKYKYEQGKREREARKKQHISEVKGIRLKPDTNEHDFQFKLRHILRFLKQGDKVKITVIFRSREITHPEFARRALDRLAEETSEVAAVEKHPGMEGRTMTMILSPK
jgi:translation initiation factor IF-3